VRIKNFSFVATSKYILFINIVYMFFVSQTN